MNETLKPCPFCGSAGEIGPDEFDGSDSAFCSNTNCYLSNDRFAMSPDEWNTRTTEAAEPFAWHLPSRCPSIWQDAITFSRLEAERLLSQGRYKGIEAVVHTTPPDAEAAEPVACSQCSGPENVCDALQDDDVRSCPCKCHNTLAEILCPSCDGTGVDVSAPDDAGVGGDVDECPTCGGDGTLVGNAKSPAHPDTEARPDALLERLRGLVDDWKTSDRMETAAGAKTSEEKIAAVGLAHVCADELERAMEDK